MSLSDLIGGFSKIERSEERSAALCRGREAARGSALNAAEVKETDNREAADCPDSEAVSSTAFHGRWCC